MQQKLGILGGGQLGRMMITPCIDLGIEVFFLDPNPQCSVSEFTSHLTVGDFKDYQTVLDFGKNMDVITVEIEHVNVEALEALEEMGKKVFPSSKILKTVQDKGLQKQFYKNNNLPTSDFRLIEDVSEIDSFPIVQKARTGGYDGKGVQVLKSKDDLEKAFQTPSVLEDLVDIEKEIGVIVVRNERGEVSIFPSVDMEFCEIENLVKYVKCPSGLEKNLEAELNNIVKKLVDKLDLVGILAVEFFLTQSGEILINEMAPRVHNSGHLTIEGTTFSQFEMHIRAVMGLPLPEVKITQPSVMVNLLGEPGCEGIAMIAGLDTVLSKSRVYLHWYGKKETKPARKMGHVTIVRGQIEAAKKVGDEVLDNLKVISSS